MLSAQKVKDRSEAHLELNSFRRKHDCALVIKGDSLEVAMTIGVMLFEEGLVISLLCCLLEKSESL